MSLRRKWKKKDDLYIIDNYSSVSKEDIAKKLNRTPFSIKRRASLLGVKKTEHSPAWSDDEVRKLKKLFPKETKDVILNNIDRPWTAIRVKAVKMGIRRINRYRMRSGVNHYFFDTWSDKMSYILGFIAADGNISKNIYKLGIKLAVKDIKHLSNIRDLLAPERKLYASKDKKYVSLEVSSKYMCNQIVSLGIVPNKSLILKFPHVPDKYVKHFIRGYFDGDGCISKYNGYYKSYFLGTEDFLNHINDEIYNKCEIKQKNIMYVKQSNIYKLSYSTNDSIKIAKWLYEGSTIHLDRKHNKFKQLLSERGN